MLAAGTTIVVVNIACARIFESRLAVKMLETSVEVKGLNTTIISRISFVMNRLRDKDVNPTDQIDHFDKTLEIDPHIIVDRVADKGAHRVHGKLWSATSFVTFTQCIGSVDLSRKIVAGDIDPEIARQ